MTDLLRAEMAPTGVLRAGIKSAIRSSPSAIRALDFVEERLGSGTLGRIQPAGDDLHVIGAEVNRQHSPPLCSLQPLPAALRLRSFEM